MQFHIIQLCMKMIESEWTHHTQTIRGNHIVESASLKDLYGELDTCLTRDAALQRVIVSFHEKPFHEKLKIMWALLNEFKVHY